MFIKFLGWVFVGIKKFILMVFGNACKKSVNKINSAKNTISSFNLLFTLNQSLLFGRSIVKAKKILREKKTHARTSKPVYTHHVTMVWFIYMFISSQCQDGTRQLNHFFIFRGPCHFFLGF